MALTSGFFLLSVPSFPSGPLLVPHLWQGESSGTKEGPGRNAVTALSRVCLSRLHPEHRGGSFFLNGNTV